MGFCCGYLIFITENLSAFIPSVPKGQWLLLILPPLFFLTLIPDLSRLAVFSLLAQVSNLLAFAVVYWFDFEHLHLAQAATRKEVRRTCKKDSKMETISPEIFLTNPKKIISDTWKTQLVKFSENTN